MFTKGHCSPRQNSENISCLSKKGLQSIAKVLNKEYKAKINLKQSKKRLFQQIKKVMKNQSSCSTESCWIKIDQIMGKLPSKEQQIIKNSFRPFQPGEWKEKPNTWLNTNDIDNVMFQYEVKYPHFKYYSATPIDFDLDHDGKCLVSSLCNINLKNIQKDNKSCIGLVFNVDPHNKPGQHWFSMFIDLKGENREKPTIYYFDSASATKEVSKVPRQILELVEELQKQTNYGFDFLYNDIQHQYGDTECGVYCLHFLTEMLKGILFENYIHKKLSDKKMERFRKRFFIE